MTKTFIKISINQNLDDSDVNQEYINKIILNNDIPSYKKMEIDSRLLKKSLNELISEFDIGLFQIFILFSSVCFKKNEQLINLKILFQGSPLEMSFHSYSQKSLFQIKRKRKDDIMNSFYKYIQRNLFEKFKKQSNDKSSKVLKEKFRKYYFEENSIIENAFYSNLFNRKNLKLLRQNKKLFKDLKSFFKDKVLDKLIHERFLKSKKDHIFDLYSDKLFSKQFINLISKKQISIIDTLKAFYSLENYLVGESNDD